MFLFKLHNEIKFTTIVIIKTSMIYYYSLLNILPKSLTLDIEYGGSLFSSSYSRSSDESKIKCFY